MRRTTIAAGLALAALMIGWVQSAHACPGAGVPAGSQTTSSASAAVICLINKRRHHQGVRRLRPSVALGSAAQVHSDAMDSQDFFSHDGSDGSPAARAAGAGYMLGARDWEVGENLGYGVGSAGSPRAMVRAWMASPQHRKVVLERFWRQIGVGVAEGSPIGPDGPGMATYTVDFGYRRG
jgi:uncharacterized protein YkwD